MPAYDIRFRYRDREDQPTRTRRVTALDPDTARRQFLADHPRTIVCGAPLLASAGAASWPDFPPPPPRAAI